MSFSSPLWLLALLLPPAAAVTQRLARARAGRYALRFPAVATLRQASATTRDHRRHIAAACLLLAAAALAVALARPHVASAIAVRQASLVLVLDHSGSMAAVDVQPTRLAAATRAADAFLNQLPSTVRVGVVAFSTTADTVLAPTADRAAVRQAVDSQIANGGTATGDALAAAMNLLQRGSKRTGRAAIVLLSDGAANAGQDPISVATRAARAGIEIDTVALGTPGGTVPSADPFAPAVPVPPDPQLMRQIAQASHGRSFTAQDAGQLGAIYNRLGTQLASRPTQRDITAAFAGAGLALLLIATAASVRTRTRLP